MLHREITLALGRSLRRKRMQKFDSYFIPGLSKNPQQEVL